MKTHTTFITWLNEIQETLQQNKYDQIQQYTINAQNYKLQHAMPTTQAPTYFCYEDQLNTENIQKATVAPDLHSFVISPSLMHYSLPLFANSMSNSEMKFISPIPVEEHLHNERCINQITTITAENKIVEDLGKYQLASLLASYKDLLIETSFIHKLRIPIIFHIVNHVLIRNKQICMGDELAEASKVEAPTKEAEYSNKLCIKLQVATTKDLKDQGYHKPKVLILCPTKEDANVVIKAIISIYLGKWKGVSKKKKFKEEYLTDNEKSSDYFRIGLCLTKDGIELFKAFEESDIIVASPLGIRNIDKSVDANDTVKAMDFLSSIEILLLYNSQEFSYQNMEHIEIVLKHVNKPPTKLKSINDINRIRPMFLDGLSRYFRQTIVFGSFNEWNVLSLMQKCSQNITGFGILKDVDKGYTELLQIPNARITMKRIDQGSYIDTINSKFSVFTTKLWPQIKISLTNYSVIIVSTYYDFLRLKKFYKDGNESFSFISEHYSHKKLQRNKSLFENTTNAHLLITERALHYKLVKLRYINNLIVYGMPLDVSILSSVLPLIGDKAAITKLLNIIGSSLAHTASNVAIEGAAHEVHMLYSSYDWMELERFVGTGNLQEFLHSKIPQVKLTTI